MHSAKTLFNKLVVLASTLVLLCALYACAGTGTPSNEASTQAELASSSSLSEQQSTEEDARTNISGTSENTDDTLARLFEKQESDVQVQGQGVVLRLLEDDTKEDRHQRFVLELKSGQTLLVAHNIDVAPRLDGLAVGDTVRFNGVYFYNEQGGGIHWTHHDASKRHEDGWLYWSGSYYE